MNGDRAELFFPLVTYIDLFLANNARKCLPKLSPRKANPVLPQRMVLLITDTDRISHHTCS